MSFPRHREIYRSDGRGRSWALVWSRSWARSWGSAWIWGWARSGAEAAPGAHRFDESPAGYSLAGWSPPEPASASPAQSSMHQNGTERYTFTVNGSLSLIKLSHARGSLHSRPVPRSPQGDSLIERPWSPLRVTVRGWYAASGIGDSSKRLYERGDASGIRPDLLEPRRARFSNAS